MSNRVSKVGRNDPCPCGAKKPDGSSVKYKKCCLPKEPASAEILSMARKVLQKQQKEKEELAARGIFVNYVKPCTYTNPKTGQKVRAWALGNQLFHTRYEHETFHQFIIDHFQKQVLGREWWDEQSRSQQKHFLFQCFVRWEEWSKKNATEGNRTDEHTWHAVPDGWAKTLVSLAFDVSTLKHTGQLPDHMLKRLKNRGEYQGAHYEIAVAAIFARLGCRITFLDDQKTSSKHCEFIATHQETGVSVAVEAKSRQRAGVKHMGGDVDPAKLLKGDVQRLFNRALEQNPKDKPFIIFIDVNAPLTPDVPMEKKPWFNDIKNMMDQYPAPTPETPEEYTGVIFTNFSSHYDAENEASANEHLAVIPRYAKHPMPNPAFGEMLLRAVQHYGYVPNIVEDRD